MTAAPSPAPEDFVRVQSEPRFRALRARHRRFVFPMTVFFLLWYLAFVLVAAFAPGFMAVRLGGNITVGLVWGLLQFVTTFAITSLYVGFANRVLDPEATALREELEADAAREDAARNPQEIS